MRVFVLLLFLPGLAVAQVTTNDQALQQLGPAPAVKAPAARRAAHAGTVHRRPAAPRAARTPLPPPVAAAPPANPVIAPVPFVMPEHKPPPPPPVPVKKDAQGAATALPGGGLRVTFGAGSSDLNPATFAALRAVAAAALAQPAMQVSVTAWAPGDERDPSTPRRLSLDRALAARAVLLNAGLVSTRILAVAKGFDNIGDGPADRVDVVEVLPPPPKAPPAAAPPAPAGTPRK